MSGSPGNREDQCGVNDAITRRNTLESFGQSPKRCGFLKRLSTVASTTLAALPGISGSVSGFAVEKKNERMAVARKYHDRERIREVIETQVTDVLAKSVDNGTLSSVAVSEIPADDLHDSVESFARSSSGAMVFGILRDGNPTVRIEVKKRLSIGQFKLVVLPERDHSFAIFTPDSGVATFVSGDGKDVISTEADCDCVACYPNEYCGVSCGPYSCACLDIYWPTQCCNDCCYSGDTCGSCSEEYC